MCMAISKEDIKPLAWSAEDEPTFLKDDENKDGKSGNVAGSADTILRTRRIFKMKKNSGGRKKQSWKALNTRWVRARDEMFVNERFLEKVLQVMGRMRFGVKNSMLIALQNEKATRIATAASWRGLGVQLLPGAEAKPIWLDAGADTQRKTIVPSKWYDITQTDAGEKLTLKGTIYNTLAICRITLNQIDELKIVEQQNVTGIHYDHEARAYLVQPGQMERAMYNGIQYHEQTTQNISYKLLTQNMRDGDTYSIYVDPKHPAVFILQKKIKVSAIITVVFGIIFFSSGIATLCAIFPIFWSVIK